MTFFELPDGLTDSAATARTAWGGPDGSIIGTPTPLQIVLAASESAAVSITRVTAYTDGFALSLDVNVRGGALDVAYQHPAEVSHLFDGESLMVTPGFLRFGIEWPDGSRATNLHGATELVRALEDAGVENDDRGPPPGPVIRELGTTCTPRTAHLAYWAWPLPACGPLSFVAEWPIHEISETRRVVDAEILVEAAERAIALWPAP